ncbi:MAG: HAMP domain-containing histidine kinase [Atopobiaceae bacterium]|nr:HAMP domain-containing histidine kinase [Atopobiaceae bacterium]
MMLFFALVAVVTAVVMTVVLAFVWEGQFRGYTRENMQSLAQRTADTLSAEYRQEGKWTDGALEYARLASSASSEIGVQVVDSNGKVLYDDTWSQGRRRSSGARTNESSTIMQPTEPDSIVSADVTDDDGTAVGQVRMWAFGTEALITKSDAAFRSNSYAAIATSALVAVVLAFVMGSLASRSLTRPIKIITSTAAQIRGGDLTARTGLTGDDEIGRLGETFDSMANTLERDIKFEHRLTSDVAHELRTPLMAMLVTVEAMQDGVLPADDEHFETVSSEVRRLSRLVDAMLHLSRIENGKRQLKIESTDVVHLVRSLVSVQHQLFHERGLHLRFDDKTSRHECYADIDPDLIREAITNIMSNAMRYTSPGGWIVVSVDNDRKDAIISVADTGIGIAEEDVPKVFSRFWRSDVSRERVSGGLGVGLAITKEIVDQHNGTIAIDSELGKGTTFTIRIPLTRNHEPREV